MLFFSYKNELFQLHPTEEGTKVHYKRAVLSKNPTKIKEKMADNLMRILREGPEVSLSGSPTVSPTTAAL
jgi:hypothetical protein